MKHCNGKQTAKIFHKHRELVNIVEKEKEVKLQKLLQNYLNFIKSVYMCTLLRTYI